MASKSQSVIRLRGVRQNNLKNIDIDLPLGKLIVVTGLSGTGKSSLVFDTLHAEGNRRYAETFSPYTRQFMELLDRPDVDSIENIRPSIAIEQGNTVKTSRSTVGTMTELCDYFKVWFSHVAELFDPETGDKITLDDPQSIWRKSHRLYRDRRVMITFQVSRPGKLTWKTILESLSNQGYNRCIVKDEILKIEELQAFRSKLSDSSVLHIIQDRMRLQDGARNRFIDSVQSALHFGEGQVALFSEEAKLMEEFCEGLHRPGSTRRFRQSSANLFSFNSPVGACPDCRGFGRVIEIDDRLVMPDHNLSIEDGLIKAFSGAVYSESQRDLLKSCKRNLIPTDVPWKDMKSQHQQFVLDGDPEYGKTGRRWPNAWYGVRRFFDWLEENTYKMHVRVFLSRYRSYVTCPSCGGSRLQPESLCWKWKGYTLPQLYQLPIRVLRELMMDEHSGNASDSQNKAQMDMALEAIVTRLNYLDTVGLSYLSLDRSSRSLSGGETQRVNLTSCLGTALVDTLFILDEPSIGLHSRDIDRLISILRQLTDQGNTVVVVEHDEAIMEAADRIIEVGPEPGHAGGKIVFSGTVNGLRRLKSSPTGQFLSGTRQIQTRVAPRKINRSSPFLRMRDVRKHNLNGLDIDIPLQRLVVLSGVSGSGKSTLLYNGIYQGLLASMGKACEDPASNKSINSSLEFSEVVLVDQSPVSRTPRSNPVLFSGAWELVRKLFANTDRAKSSGMTASSFSFNSGEGRCQQCKGLGYERVEMQFMADVFVPCPVCEGKQFTEAVLEVDWRGHTIRQILSLTISDAINLFAEQPGIVKKLSPLDEVGLGYLPLGQPLNTLSGGESQRLKLVRYLGNLKQSDNASLMLLDEPTTGLHRADIDRLLQVLHSLVDRGHSLIVIEHQPDVIKSADWVLELGPEAGDAGGELIFGGTPEKLARAGTPSSPYVADGKLVSEDRQSRYKPRSRSSRSEQLIVTGAREHNLKNISTSIPRHAMTVVTGVSGSGKSTLAFDIIFAEGQRRFMESMSSWARQYVEQLPKPDIDHLSGISPTVAIEQRVTRGSRKSTVATITEVAQYLRLLYSRIGVQHSPVTGEPLVALEKKAILGHLNKWISKRKPSRGNSEIRLMAPLVRGRKGHHEPLALWAKGRGFASLRIDGEWVAIDSFKKLDRYREHNVDLLIAGVRIFKNGNTEYTTHKSGPVSQKDAVDTLLDLGKGSFYAINYTTGETAWFSTKRSDPVTGEAFPELDPKDFSWNAPRGWCPTCRGHGELYPWMSEDDRYEFVVQPSEQVELCPDCNGDRLNRISRSVFLKTVAGKYYNFPQLLSLTPGELLTTLDALDLDKRDSAILREILPEIRERLGFMDEVGLQYLSLNRSTNTLSGGEAQRIRLAAQLGSNLSGALFVLDEPSIGLHERDNQRLLDTLSRLKQKGNTLLVVEHDANTMREADHIIDLGPGAGKNGGEVLASGTVAKIQKNRNSLTGRYLNSGIKHPARGAWRSIPAKFNSRRPASRREWLVLRGASLRNLKNITVQIPTERLVMVCGISGAGKSTLVRDLLMPTVKSAINRKSSRLKGSRESGFESLLGGDSFRTVIEVDQAPIGKTPRSTPATYIGAFDQIRKFFANTPEARLHGHTQGTFSFNTKGGRCETCKGAGRIKLEMNFMPDTYVPCEDCEGRRYGPELDEITWNSKTIADILDMTFEEAAGFFSFDSKLSALLGLMVETGLGYLTLGQSSPTLSGGEAQRLKLVSELAKGLPTLQERKFAVIQKNLYILEEPTIGLHMHDCEKLIQLLHRLVDQGHTVIVIEHNVDLIAEGDYVIEIGPDGGENGGEILHQGSVRGLLSCNNSPTKPFLNKIVT